MAATGLAEWWLTRLTINQRQLIRDKYHPLSTSETEEVIDRGPWEPLAKRGFNIMMLAGWVGQVSRDHERELLEMALPLVGNTLDRHFILSNMIVAYSEGWKNSGQPEAHERACRDQIAIAPQVARAMRREFPDDPLPSHNGFHDLILLLRERGDIKEADRLEARAVKQGWSGYWDLSNSRP